jgi:hypothetical protein
MRNSSPIPSFVRIARDTGGIANHDQADSASNYRFSVKRLRLISAGGGFKPAPPRKPFLHYRAMLETVARAPTNNPDVFRFGVVIQNEIAVCGVFVLAYPALKQRSFSHRRESHPQIDTRCCQSLFGDLRSIVLGSITGPRVSSAILKPRQWFPGTPKKGCLPPSIQVGSCSSLKRWSPAGVPKKKTS